jgi:hypothetical protein
MLKSGWEKLKTVASDLTNYLEGSEHVATIQYDPIAAGAYGASVPAGNGNFTIAINANYFTPTDLAQIQGHEGLHSAVQMHRYDDADDAAKASIAYHLEPSLARESFAGSFEYVISERLGVDPLRPITRNLATHFQPPLPGSNPTDGYLYTTMNSLDVATAKSGTLQQLGYNIEALEMWTNNLDLEIYLGYVKKLWWNQ